MESSWRALQFDSGLGQIWNDLYADILTWVDYGFFWLWWHDEFMACYIMEIWIWCHCILDVVSWLLLWWHGYQFWFEYVCCIDWSTSCAVLWAVFTYRISPMTWIWVVYAHRSFIVYAYSDLVACFSHWFVDLLSCWGGEMLLPGTVMMGDLHGWLCDADRLDTLRVRCLFHGDDHDAMVVPCV